MAARRGAPARRVEHRSACSRRRRPAARLPHPAGRHRVHPDARPLTRPRCVRDRRSRGPTPSRSLGSRPSVRDAVSRPRDQCAIRNTSPGMPPVAPPPATTALSRRHPSPRRKLHRSRTRRGERRRSRSVMVLIAAAIPSWAARGKDHRRQPRRSPREREDARRKSTFLATPTQLLVSLDATGAPSRSLSWRSARADAAAFHPLPTLLRVNVPGVGDGPVGQRVRGRWSRVAASDGGEPARRSPRAGLGPRCGDMAAARVRDGDRELRRCGRHTGSGRSSRSRVPGRAGDSDRDGPADRVRRAPSRRDRGGAARCATRRCGTACSRRSTRQRLRPR